MAELKRYITEEKLAEGLSLAICGAQFNHMANVIRHRAGDRIILLNGDGFDYLCEIISVSKKSVDLKVLEKQANPRKNNVKLVMLCGLLKGDANDIQAVKCSELGVDLFIPFVSENCVISADSGKSERLKRIAAESSKQCKRAVPMQVNGVMDFVDALKYVKNCKIKLLAYENEKRLSLKAALGGAENAESVSVVIGPEGGFTDNEVKTAAEYGFVPVSLGKTILKADTAAISAAAAALCVMGEWEG